MNLQFMRNAIELAHDKMLQGCGGPFGAVIVKNNIVVAYGSNCVTSTNDPTAHAEVVAIREACKTLGQFHLQGCEIYTSCEPCPMCLCAIYWARIDTIYYAAGRQDAANIGFDDAMFYQEIAKETTHRQVPMVQLLRDEALVAFDAWQLKLDKIAY